MVNCKDCNGEIRILEAGNEYSCGCGSISCLNVLIFPTLKEAVKYAEELSGECFENLSWEGKQIIKGGEYIL